MEFTHQATQNDSLNTPNSLTAAPPQRWWVGLAMQFNQLVIWILIAAALISGLLSDWTDAVAILAIVILNALLGYFQEERAAAALAALRNLASPAARVIRDSQTLARGRRATGSGVFCGAGVSPAAGQARRPYLDRAK